VAGGGRCLTVWCVLYCLRYAGPAHREFDRLSLHDALPICWCSPWGMTGRTWTIQAGRPGARVLSPPTAMAGRFQSMPPARRTFRSEEHTSELQSRFELVFRLLLENKTNIVIFSHRLFLTEW